MTLQLPARTAKAVKAVKPANPSGINPTEFNVLVRPSEIEEKTSGGIIIPISEAEKLHNAGTDGVVIAVSPLAFGYERWPDGTYPPAAGDRVMFAKYAGMRRKGKDGVMYVVMKDKDIAAILD